MSKDNGGPAFPHHFTPDSIGDCSGMTLRDYFAAQALQGLIAGSLADGSSWDRTMPNVLPRIAYQLADEMIKERTK